MNSRMKKILKTCNVLRDNVYRTAGSVGKVEYVKCDYKKNNIPPQTGWQPFFEDMRVTGDDQHYWFKMKFTTPHVPKNRHIVLKTSTGYEGAYDPLNPQGMVFLNGRLTQALDTNHITVRLEADTEYEVFIYFYMGSGHSSSEFKIWQAYADDVSEQTYYDLWVPFCACRDVYTENSYEFSTTLRILEHACNMLELNYPFTDEYYFKADEARKYLKSEYYEKVCGNSPVTVNCVGHTHIDVAWLWSLAQTREKVQRSFSTMLELMKYYPEYRFMMSQPQLFKFMSEDDPQMYSEIKEMVKKGRFEPEGAMWLESDCNLISGESMVRQILHGKRFLKKEFDVDSKILFLPDVFGYSAAIPQILKKSGIDHFVTSKISWNDTNILPYDTFIWQGLDGSEILTDFITVQDFRRSGEFENETTYVGQITPSMVAGTWNRYQQKEYNDKLLLLYGWGDGGGGPTEDMLEQQRRLAYGLPGIPKTKMSSLSEHLSQVKDNFERACKEIGTVPKWVGELYLEFHRGTYTSIAKNKRYNRLSENLMQKLESISVLSAAKLQKKYPKQELYDMWDVILLNQFHDIIPGSSIKKVYDDSWAQYEELIDRGNGMLSSSMLSLAGNVKSDGGLFVYNSLGFKRTGVISCNGKSYEVKDIPAYGWKVVNPETPENSVHICGNTAENKFYVLTLDGSGRIAGMYDKINGKEVFVPGSYANEFCIYEDMPLIYDNWELADYYKSKCKVLSEPADIDIVDDGCRKGYKITHKYRSSTLTQYVYLYDNIARVDVENEIDWHEHDQIVKLNFPINVYATKATYDIQFGNVERNTHSNTSWDKAKFEVCGHKWVDVSDYGYGVSIINDCKYGFGAEGNKISLSVLKCGTYPNAQADQGEHRFKYSIFAHKGGFREADTVREAYSFNQPLEYVPINADENGILSDEFSFVSCDKPNIVIDTLKQCEDDGSIIIRLFESFNCSTACKLNFGVDVVKTELCDLMENSISEIAVTDNSVDLELSNFEIITLKIKI